MQNQNDDEMNFRKFWGSSQLIPRVTFSRRGSHYCIYCGSESDTREHIPSKVFLSQPYPNDLPVLPACFKCNNGFSADEMYTKSYIDSMYYLANNDHQSYNDCITKSQKAFEDAKEDFINYQKEGILKENASVVRILTKLAIGHMVYDLFEGYSIDNIEIAPFSVNYKFIFQLSSEDKEAFDDMIVMNDNVLPELGARIFDRIYVLSPMLSQNVNNTANAQYLNTSCVFLDWNDVQESNYSYVAWIENGNIIHIRIIIYDFLFAEITFLLEDIKK